MPTYSSVEELLSRIEKSVEKKFRYRFEIKTIIDIAQANEFRKEFDDLLFFSKFLTNAHSILVRSGVGNDDVQKLSIEFAQRMELVSNILRKMLEKTSAEIRNRFSEQFLLLNQTSVQNMLSLVKELAWLKNYEIDTNQPLW
ncbi:MAG TPA: hypothetical protein VKS81_07850 [Bacteroidota bacterium]|nr:hypothetical protein [Bacteroidota bacterium]